LHKGIEMYLIINRSNMSLKFKLEGVYGLPSEFNTHPYVVVITEDPNPFRTFTDLELKLLYRELGSVSGAILNTREGVLEALMKLVKAKPFNSVHEETLFTTPSARAPASGTAPANASANANVPSAPVAPAGGVMSVIWEHADIVWAKAGSPLDVPTIMKLRRAMMDDLEEQGIKRNTASNGLGAWMKTKLP
jgi:hypothetical protein